MTDDDLDVKEETTEAGQKRKLSPFKIIRNVLIAFICFMIWWLFVTPMY